ncbi:acyltransferase [[Clostridium] fimetarium]|uniref:Surface polysaccharide O-acyltransferase, integral membrane enzyme n=1 Tax=[Clostridium] fimetarium TaxID=99656 RepID=A0A1I0RGJ7_9FIRM|nr:acyltransferase family protein [[Clostridium] fimetarium]SEW40004.1 Surface polysaccharide O-acyltransferase, integral membrane enzyme [[Clostridium] fimetarium]
MGEVSANINVNKRKMWIDYLRIISAFAVIMIHVVYLGRLTFWVGTDTTICLIFFNSLCFAVPIFVMITGYLQLNPEKEYNFKKSIIRIVSVLCIFGVIYAWMELIFIEHAISFDQIGKTIINMIQGKSWVHLWYLYMLIGLYLIIPFLRTWIKYASEREIKYFLILNFVFNSVLVRLAHYGISSAFYIQISTIFPFYLVLGYYLGNYRKKVSGKVIGIAWCVCLVSLYIVSAYLKILFDAYNYNNIITIVMVILIFLTFKTLPEVHWGRNAKACIDSFARCSFGIYILHMVFVNALYKFLKVNPYKYWTVIFWIVISLVIFILSWITSLLLMKLPFFRKIL